MLGRRRPWIRLQYEPDLESYTEPGVASGAKLDISSVENPDVVRVFEASHSLDRSQFWPWIQENKDSFSPSTVFVDTADGS